MFLTSRGGRRKGEKTEISSLLNYATKFLKMFFAYKNNFLKVEGGRLMVFTHFDLKNIIWPVEVAEGKDKGQKQPRY